MQMVLAILSLLVVFGALMSGFGKNYDLNSSANQTVDAPLKCIDYDPPSTTDIITIDSTQYGLIKKAAGIHYSQKFFAVAKKIADVNGKPAYILPKDNYYGKTLGTDFIFVQQDSAPDYLSGKTSSDILYFSIYFKEGLAIPDDIKTNCSSAGGKILVGPQTKDAFPPQAFNTSQVTGGGALTAPAYVYNNFKTTSSRIRALPSVFPGGTLFIKNKNRSYELLTQLGGVYLVDGVDAYSYAKSDKELPVAGDKSTLQMDYFYYVEVPSIGWWEAPCKPVIYLYPEKKMKVNVEVHTKGELTVTKPHYKANGWDAIAYPDGVLQVDGVTYPYLYYESKIPDYLVKKPQDGYVVAYQELDESLARLLPQLGLTKQEQKDFREYWSKALPYAPYYFIGSMSESSIDAVEPLEIAPHPDTTIRVRLYFEGRRNKDYIKPPSDMLIKGRQGFTVVEWGGMAKLVDGSTFTCSL